MKKSGGLYLEGWLGDQGYDVYRMASDVNYARRATAEEWLRENDYEPDEILAYEIGESSERAERDRNAIQACLKLWLRSMGHEKMLPTPNWRKNRTN